LKAQWFRLSQLGTSFVTAACNHPALNNKTANAFTKPEFTRTNSQAVRPGEEIAGGRRDSWTILKALLFRNLRVTSDYTTDVTGILQFSAGAAGGSRLAFGPCKSHGD
jgi:hypothetical protein